MEGGAPTHLDGRQPVNNGQLINYVMLSEVGKFASNFRSGTKSIVDKVIFANFRR